MATKGTKLPNDSEDFDDKTKTKTPEERSELARIAAQARKSNEAKAKAEARKSNVPDEVYIRNWDAITEADLAIAVIKKDLKQAEGVLRNRYATAKADGCNIEAIKILRKAEKIDIDEFDHDMKTVARIAHIVGSPIAETSLMALLGEADKVNYYTQGFTAGKAGDNADTNPNKPGTEEFEKWAKGWRDGQAKLGDDFIKQSNAKNGKGAKDKSKLN